MDKKKAIIMSASYMYIIAITFKLTKLGTPEKFQELPLLFSVKFYHTLLAISS